MANPEPEFKNKTCRTVYELVKKPIADAGYLLWDIDFFKEGADHDLLVTIENTDPGIPIGLEDCEKVSRILSPILDEADPIAQSYFLEVSSAGLGRVLRFDFQLERYIGKETEAMLFKPIDGMKKYRGKLLGFDEEKLVLSTAEKGEITLERKAVSKFVSADEEI